MDYLYVSMGCICRCFDPRRLRSRKGKDIFAFFWRLFIITVIELKLQRKNQKVAAIMRLIIFVNNGFNNHPLTSESKIPP